MAAQTRAYCACCSAPDCGWTAWSECTPTVTECDFQANGVNQMATWQDRLLRMASLQILVHSIVNKNPQAERWCLCQVRNKGAQLHV